MVIPQVGRAIGRTGETSVTASLARQRIQTVVRVLV
jgi:hypothetical protein